MMHQVQNKLIQNCEEAINWRIPQDLDGLITSFLIQRVFTTISPDAKYLLRKACDEETDTTSLKFLKTYLENVHLAERQKKPVCQSPGLPAIYIKYGDGMSYIINQLKETIQRAIISSSKAGFLRPSVVNPLSRKNTGDNSGIGIPYTELEYDSSVQFIEVIISFKGCGAELGNALKIFTPAEIGKNAKGIKKFVIDTVIKANGKPCPPFSLGIGIGGQMHDAARLSRHAVSTRKWTDKNTDSALAAMEEELLYMINKLGIGPGGIGGRHTALSVKIAMNYTHSAICPVAVNFHCWVARRSGIRIYPDGNTIYLFDD
jgi:fumarate hydratase subunit alpha